VADKWTLAFAVDVVNERMAGALTVTVAWVAMSVAAVSALTLALAAMPLVITAFAVRAQNEAFS